MEKNINIAAILKDKPQGTKLYDLLYNIDVELDTISTTDTETVVWCINGTTNNITCHLSYSEFGTVRGCPDGLQILLPSKEMRDWSKFAWKKGDVLTDEERFVIFKNFDTDDYTEFTASFEYKDGACRRNLWLFTNDFRKVPDNIAQEIIKKVEKHYGGKLNLETLEIEKQPEFKDGDILYITDRIESCNYILIYKNQEGRYIYRYATMLEDNFVIMTEGGFLSDNGGLSKRYATEEEKQQLFETLAKKGKAWDAEKKAIVDLPKKFKAFDKVLVRDTKDEFWRPAFFASLDEHYITEYAYGLIGDPKGVFCKYCIPYNEETVHLIGTTDDWKVS